MWTTGANSPFKLIQDSKKYTVKDIVQNIRCPTLVLEAEKDDSYPGQPKKVYDALTCPKKYILFTAEEGVESIVNVVLLLFQISEYLTGWMKHLGLEEGLKFFLQDRI